MTVTPARLLDLALARHRSPWNWTVHCAAAVVLVLALPLHSALALSAGLVLFGAGFFRWPEPLRQGTRWLQFAHRAVEWEKDWIAAPWNRYKWSRFLGFLLVAGVAAWALWTREPATLALLGGFAYLARVVRENRDGGIDP
ncbi:MAG: hypothetical protein V3571_15720 [Pseudodesulfovibrio sp.]